MSSLQKFHRRTMSLGPVTWPPTAIGGGDVANGYWLGGPTFNALVVAPKSTEVKRTWGSSGTVRGTSSTTDGIANTNTLAGFGQAAHPAAYYCRTLTTGGYNTWYQAADNELIMCFSNQIATPFYTTDSFTRPNSYQWSSTESSSGVAMLHNFESPTVDIFSYAKTGSYYVRAVRRYTFPTATIGSGDSSNGYWLGTAGDGVSKLVVAPTSTHVRSGWGSYGTVRGTTSTTNGLANTNTLFGFGSAAHPAAYYCKTLTTGGYTTWYLPAKDELNTVYSNKSAVPFATANAFLGGYYWSSTENTSNSAFIQNLYTGDPNDDSKSRVNYGVLAVRRV